MTADDRNRIELALRDAQAGAAWLESALRAPGTQAALDEMNLAIERLGESRRRAHIATRALRRELA